ncbi:MAG: RluA family pseudouridine synthase [Rhodospirillales bacterium]|nr:RluA family pseudouridine synthase [Rhodospirillales bacterium]
MTDPLSPSVAGGDDGGGAGREVREEEGGLRLDRWFRRHYPGLSHGWLEKLLRGGQVRVDGRRAHAGDRLEPGQRVRVPPLGEAASVPHRPARRPQAADLAAASEGAAALRSRILFEDEAVIAFDKPSGLAVQGGSGTRNHLDGMLDHLVEGDERPRLVHRLDKDTSGVIVLARTAAAAAYLARAFRERSARKVYWAIVTGVPDPPAGRIDIPLAKRPGRAGERMQGDDAGDFAVSDYAVVERAGRHAAWLELCPLTGRTHQLRAHCAAIGTPILGDGKYGGRNAFMKDAADVRALHLHARRLTIPHPGGGTLTVEAPLPPHMRALWQRLGLTDLAAGPPRREKTGAGAPPSGGLAPGRSSAPATAKHRHQRRQRDHRAAQRQPDRDRQK